MLLLEDYDLDAEMVQDHLERSGNNYEIHRVENKESFEEFLKDAVPDVILSDYNLPSYSAMEAFIKVKELDLKIPFIIVTGDLPEERAIEFMKEGIDDYIIKSSLMRLGVAIEGAREKRRISSNLANTEKRFKQIFQQAAVAIAAFECPKLYQRFSEMMSKKQGRHLQPEDMFYVLKYLKMTDINEEAIKLFKADSPEHLSKKFFGLFDQSVFQWISKCFGAMVSGERTAQEEVIATNLAGEKLYLRMKISIDPSDVESFNVSMIDLSNEKRSEKRVTKLMERLENTIDHRTKELQEANKKLKNQANDRERITKVLRENYVQMTDSIIAAKRIQQLMLPNIQNITDGFDDAFVYLRPKDIVSGDFYWYYKRGQKAWIACVDCTGHGVPGAFMSMISSKILNQIVIEQQTESTATILEAVDDYVIRELKQHESETQVSTGMDISLCCFDADKKQLHYSGAFHSLYHFQNGEMEELKGNRFAIGGTFKMDQKKFTEHVVKLQEGDCIYMLTDGYLDQFGGPKNKKFTRKRFIDLLHSVQGKSMFDQEMQ
ncbi:MAG: SpoIIE family protein phosphatase, partial [Bacteroidota bacterium]